MNNETIVFFIVGAIFATFFGFLLLAVTIDRMIENKALKKHKKKKVSKTARISALETKVEVLNFKVENPHGLKVEYYHFGGGWKLFYVTFFDEIKSIKLPYADGYKIVKDKIVNNWGDEYVFDRDSEILVQITKAERGRKNDKSNRHRNITKK